MSWGAFFYPHTVHVRDIGAGSGFGQSFGVARALAAEVKDEQRIVRDRDGREVVSNTQVTVDLGAGVAPGSLVTVWKGTSAEREAQVLAVGRDDNGDSMLDSFLVLSLE
ncbi:MAG: hypothetical protein AB7V10_07955 [Leucobacter sp.]